MDELTGIFDNQKWFKLFHCFHANVGSNAQFSLCPTVCVWLTSICANRKLLHAKVRLLLHTHCGTELTRQNHSLSCLYKDETSTSDSSSFTFLLVSKLLFGRKKFYDALLRRVHLNCVGLIGRCPRHSTIKSDKIRTTE